MDTLINELTLYSKIDTNRIPYDFAKLNVAAYFKDCVEEIGLDLEAKGIALSYFNYATPDTQIIADPEQLRRVINNIIGNSVKYMNKTEKFINIRIKDVGTLFRWKSKTMEEELHRKICRIFLTGFTGRMLPEIRQPVAAESDFPL